ncbi:helix-turn-helix domain-containing protein [Actinokineospora enzanensis]|uniref:helix-turn-helix domain-containing protein n=1 Tax=Actinokineospora enzanensis TaxID=155975 RepID=UPI00037E071F|nr:helix-turn-helix transcriptional regulator [Actinokineospora enzanensis]
MATSPTAARRQIGRALGDLRRARGLTLDAAAESLGFSASKVSRLETGQSTPPADDLARLIDFYEASAEDRAELEDLARAARQRRPRTTYGKSLPSFFHRYLGLERAASEIRIYCGEIITGLLQTADYARAVTTSSPLHDSSEIDRFVEARSDRQARLTAPSAPRLWVIMSEAAIRRIVGGPATMREQLAQLAHLGRLPNVTIQVVPFSRGAVGAEGFDFTMLRFPDDHHDVVYLEDLTTATYLDRKDDPARQAYAAMWEHVSAAALDPDATALLVDTALREL